MSNKKISIIGTGKLGLCLALTLESSGYSVLGCDLDENYVKSLNEKSFFSHEKGVTDLLRKSQNFEATTSISDCIDFSDIIFVLVATPSLPDGKYNHSFIDSIIDQLEILGKKENKILVIGCTTYPGYCESIEGRLSTLGYKTLYNPEFIAQGDILRGQTHPDLVLIGESCKKSGDLLEDIHRSICKSSPHICRLSLTESEIAKISINCFITTKISFANMVGDLCNKMNLRSESVLDAVGKDTRIGEKYLKWGFGFGGPCFPRDNRALGILCRENEIYPSIPVASDEYNGFHLSYQKEYMKSNLKDNKIFFDGVSYKKGSVLIEESQQLKIAEMLADDGVEVTICDKEVVIDQVRPIMGEKFKYVVRNETN